MDQPRHEDRILCLECGRWYRALPTHLLRRHKMNDEAYRLKFGIPVGSPLVCGEWSENQRQHNANRDSSQTLTARGPQAGYTQRESVRRRRQGEYRQLAKTGVLAAASVDRTAERRALLCPYPVTIRQACDRLNCSRSAAYTFLSACVALGHLRRVGRGLYAV